MNIRFLKSTPMNNLKIKYQELRPSLLALLKMKAKGERQTANGMTFYYNIFIGSISMEILVLLNFFS